MIPIYKPYIAKYKTSAIDAINSEWISNHGKYIKLASDALTGILGTTYCILMNNGTSATHCLFKALKFKHPNLTKIYIPNCVFVAPWNCCLMEYPDTMIEVMKMDLTTLNIDTSEEYFNTLEHGAAICIVHNLGNIINVPRLKRLRPDLIFIEDNCEGLFGKYEDAYSGTASLCSAVSFYGNKTITTGEGGAFFTDDIDVYNYINSVYSHGMSNIRYIHTKVATNFRMTNIQAAFLYDQLKDIDSILQLKRDVFVRYNTFLNSSFNSGKICPLKLEDNTNHSMWMYCVIIPNRTYSDIETYMKEHNIEIRPLFYDIHSHPYLTNIMNMHDTEELKQVQASGCMLPSYPELTEAEQKYICETLIGFINT